MTQKEIARIYGVSTMTVSRVLSGKAGNKVSLELAEKIRETARQGNYRENRLAKAMRTGFVPLSALCLYQTFSGANTGNYWFDIVCHHTAILSAHQQEVLLVPFRDTSELDYRLDTLRRPNLISSVVANIMPGCASEEIRILQKLGLPYVIFGNVNVPEVPYVYVDNNTVADFLLEMLRSKGAKSIGYYSQDYGLPSEKQIADESCFFHVDSTLYKRILHCKTGVREDRIYIVTHHEQYLNGDCGFVVNNHTKERCENAWKLLKMQMDGQGLDSSLFRIAITGKDIRYVPPIDKL